ncbi:unnamed protein product [Pieris brassicae]|uniref:Uncharacterized protein n=1 Tax=Pieris brassicae TaxID=7116 RepID=A0A9P0TDF6_PIEBR|nr:unnamed protein product [Pieris brassicae]
MISTINFLNSEGISSSMLVTSAKKEECSSALIEGTDVSLPSPSPSPLAWRLTRCPCVQHCTMMINANSSLIRDPYNA